MERVEIAKANKISKSFKKLEVNYEWVVGLEKDVSEAMTTAVASSWHVMILWFSTGPYWAGKLSFWEAASN